MLRFAVLVLLLAFAPPGAAQEETPGTGEEVAPKAATVPSDSLAALVGEALAHNPELVAARERVRAMQARVPQAGALPDPVLRSGVLNEKNAVPFDTLGEGDFSEVYLGITQDLPFPGKRALRENVARDEATAQEHALEGLRLRVSMQVADTYYDLYAARAARALLEGNFHMMDELAGVARARFAVGHGMQQDALDAELEISRLEERRSLLENQQELLTAELDRLLNRTRPKSSPRSTTLVPPLDVAPLSGSLAQWLARADAASPAVSEQSARVTAAEHRLELARRERMPDFGLDLSYHNRGNRDLDPYYGIGATVTLPIYAGRKQSRAIEEAAAELAAARSAVNAARAQLRLEVTQAYVQVQSSDRLLRLYDQGLLDQGRLVFDSASAQYQVGKLTFPSVIASWDRVLENEIAYRTQQSVREKAMARLRLQAGELREVRP